MGEFCSGARPNAASARRPYVWRKPRATAAAKSRRPRNASCRRVLLNTSSTAPSEPARASYGHSLSAKRPVLPKDAAGPSSTTLLPPPESSETEPSARIRNDASVADPRVAIFLFGCRTSTSATSANNGRNRAGTKRSIFVSLNNNTFSSGLGAPRESNTEEAASSSLSSSDITEFILLIVPPPACRGAGKAPTNALKTANTNFGDDASIRCRKATASSTRIEQGRIATACVGAMAAQPATPPTACHGCNEPPLSRTAAGTATAPLATTADLCGSRPVS
mmetsp:Transcript_24234/g.63179  ORF Transcript_24234/g.63179 Transcript_24234/m.63179 type:complete len:279 (-) Transcript_24234:473-1309(-)